jgi:Cu/Ag efflux protein CusF
MISGFQRRPRRPLASLLGVACATLAIAACGSGDEDVGGTPDGEVQEFAFTGTVQSIDTTTNIVSVAGAEVPGWMMAMTMNYYLEPASVLESLEPGDQITATVHAGDFQRLYQVRVVE